MRSPSASTCAADGMPCTICSFTEAQIEAGKPWYPRNDGTAPAARMTSSAMASRSFVLTPTAVAAVTAASASATTAPAARIASSSPGVLSSMSRPRHRANIVRTPLRPIRWIAGPPARGR